MITIFHNPKCKKSREGLAFITSLNIEFCIRNYFEQPFSVIELKELFKYFNEPIITLIRTQEDDYKKLYKGKDLNDEEWITVLVNSPKLLQRPLVFNNAKLILAQPVEKILSII